MWNSLFFKWEEIATLLLCCINTVTEIRWLLLCFRDELPPLLCVFDILSVYFIQSRWRQMRCLVISQHCSWEGQKLPSRALKTCCFRTPRTHTDTGTSTTDAHATRARSNSGDELKRPPVASLRTHKTEREREREMGTVNLCVRETPCACLGELGGAGITMGLFMLS